MQIIAEAADALHAIHTHDVVYGNVHRGLRLREDGSVVLDGFYDALPVTTRTDIYELGVLAYGILTLDWPDSSSAYHFDKPWPRLRDVRSDVRAVIEKMVAVNPDNRYPTAAAVANAARDTLTGHGG